MSLQRAAEIDIVLTVTMYPGEPISANVTQNSSNVTASPTVTGGPSPDANGNDVYVLTMPLIVKDDIAVNGTFAATVALSVGLMMDTVGNAVKPVSPIVTTVGCATTVLAITQTDTTSGDSYDPNFTGP